MFHHGIGEIGHRFTPGYANALADLEEWVVLSLLWCQGIAFILLSLA